MAGMAGRQATSRIQRRLATAPGVRSIRRPVTAGGSAEFDLYYLRAGPASDHPVLDALPATGALRVAATLLGLAARGEALPPARRQQANDAID